MPVGQTPTLKPDAGSLCQIGEECILTPMRSELAARSVCLWLGLLGFLALGQAQADTIYVSTQGSDSNPGTFSQPLRTISYAYSLATAGTTILVMPGLYTDYTSGWGIHLGANGTASNPIVLRSQTPGAAVIDGLNASDGNVCLNIDGSYNIVDGFEIKNGLNGGIAIWADNNTILNCNIHNNGNSASSSPQGQDGIYSNEGTSGNRYSGNFIGNNGRSGSHLDHGLYLCGANELVNNNIIVANAACGVQVAGYTTVSNLKIYNNVIALNGSDGIILWQSLNGVDIRNNILYQNGQWAVGSYAAQGSGVVVDHNLSYRNASGDFNFTDGGSSYAYSLGTTLYSDPQLANATAIAFDGHLLAGSPAIQAGMNLYSTFTTDITGAPWPASGAWDLGAYVYGATPTNGSGTGLTNNVATVTITAPVPTAVIGTTNFGVITFQRNGSTTSPLAVTYSLGGTAIKWNDYRRADSGDMPTSITIPAGAASYSMSIWAVGNQTGSSNEYFTLTLAPDPSYQIGSPSSATMTIASTTTVSGSGPFTNASVPVRIGNSATGITLTWKSVPGKTYLVTTKNQLDGSNLTPLSPNILATDSMTSWVDTTADKSGQRYYVVSAVN